MREIFSEEKEKIVVDGLKAIIFSEKYGSLMFT